MRRLRVLSAGSVGISLAPTLGLIGLVWIMQACCCGGPYAPAPGPPGSVAGSLQFPVQGKSQALTVYAVDSFGLDRNGFAAYAMTRVAPPVTTYVLAVPPGIYEVVARLDSDPLSSAGYMANSSVNRVRVESRQAVTGINIGDWGAPDSLRVIWDVDVHGSPLPASLEPTPSPKLLPSRPIPSEPSPELSGEFASTVSGARFPIPTGWQEIKPPYPMSVNPNDNYFSNEAVASPLALDPRGVWLTVRWDIQEPCPDPDWRFATDQARVVAQTNARSRGGPLVGHQFLYFEDPAGRANVQPFTGYSLWGAASHYLTGLNPIPDCIEFIFTATTSTARDSNLATIGAILQSATFTNPH
jgi:hypothetical protein